MAVSAKIMGKCLCVVTANTAFIYDDGLGCIK